MLKILPKTGINSLVFSIILIIIVFCAGCSDEATPSTPQQTPALTAGQVKFVEGDIIAKSATSADLSFVILNYDSTNDTYERAFVNKKSDGRWVRSNDKSEFADRVLVEKVYPAKVGHVDSLSHISIETQTKNVPSTPPPPRTQTPASGPTKTQTLSPRVDPIVGTWKFTNSYDENGTMIHVVCTHQFVSSGTFSHSCTGTGEPVQETDYGQWENLGDNAYIIQYPDINNPEQPYGFYEGFYYNLRYNPGLDTLTIVSGIMNESVVLTRAKNS